MYLCANKNYDIRRGVNAWFWPKKWDIHQLWFDYAAAMLLMLMSDVDNCMILILCAERDHKCDWSTIVWRAGHVRAFILKLRDSIWKQEFSCYFGQAYALGINPHRMNNASLWDRVAFVCLFFCFNRSLET